MKPTGPKEIMRQGLEGVIKEWKLGVAKQGLLKSGDPNVWKAKGGVAGHWKPTLVALSCWL